MKHLKYLAIAAVVAIPLMATFAGVASATTLEITGTKQTGAVTIKVSLEPGSSMVTADELGTTMDTCTGSTIESTTTASTAVSGNPIHGNVSSLTFTSCSHTSDVVSKGGLSIRWIKGTTNGTVSSYNAEIPIRSTFFGITVTCKTGNGTDIGTLTGKASGQATLDLNATVDCGALGNTFWAGSYVVTSPEGLGVVE
jgi:hypothetical protein